jgi:hypothetical protein
MAFIDGFGLGDSVLNSLKNIMKRQFDYLNSRNRNQITMPIEGGKPRIASIFFRRDEDGQMQSNEGAQHDEEKGIHLFFDELANLDEIWFESF